MRASASAAGVVLARLHVKMNHSRLKLGTCESFFSFESNRPVLRQQLFTLYTYSEYLIHRYFVFVTNESDVRTTELRTEYTCLFQFSHKTRQTLLLYAYFTPKVDFKRKFNHHQSFLYE